MTKNQLLKDKSSLEKNLKDPDMPKEVRDPLEDALKNINEMIANGDYTGGASRAKPGKKTKIAGKKSSGKKEQSPLDNCKEILAKYNKEKAGKKKRLAKRQRAGKPAELTVNETLKKTAKAVDNKIEKAEDDGNKFNAKSALNGIGDILEAVFSNTDEDGQREFFIELAKLFQKLRKKHGYKGKSFAVGGITDDDLYGYDYRQAVYKGDKGAELAEKAKTSFENQGYTAYVVPQADLGIYQVFAEKRKAEEGMVLDEGEEEGDNDQPGPVDYPAGKNMRIFSYRTENFDICPEAEAMFDNILQHPDSDRVKGFIVAVAKDIDAFLGVIKKRRESGNVTTDELINATGHLMKSMYFLYPVLTKMIGNDDPTQYYPRFAGPYMAQLAGVVQHKGRGGRIKSALNRDRAYESDQPHEVNYKRKSSPVHPRYNKKKKGGNVKFKDKVSAISKSLKGTKVSKKYQPQYGKKYNATEAKAAAKRIAGAMEKNKKTPQKKLFGGVINIRSIDNLEAHSGDANFPN